MGISCGYSGRFDLFFHDSGKADWMDSLYMFIYKLIFGDKSRNILWGFWGGVEYDIGGVSHSHISICSLASSRPHQWPQNGRTQ